MRRLFSVPAAVRGPDGVLRNRLLSFGLRQTGDVFFQIRLLLPEPLPGVHGDLHPVQSVSWLHRTFDSAPVMAAELLHLMRFDAGNLRQAVCLRALRCGQHRSHVVSEGPPQADTLPAPLRSMHARVLRRPSPWALSMCARRLVRNRQLRISFLRTDLCSSFRRAAP